MKNAKRFSATALASVLALAATAAFADPPYPADTGPVQFTDTARVVSSTPVYQQINQPTRECWQEQTGYVTEPSGDHSYGGAILGAIVGGVVGHQIGGGGGKDAATAAGAAIGALTGDRMDNSNQTVQSRPVVQERCRTVDHWTRRVTGYNVTYRYKGNTYTSFMTYDPGATVRINVSVGVADQ